jgi:ABC-type lipoprotein export system ATPase subunit
MLEFSSVSKSFWTGTQRKVILDRASFRVKLGTSLGILAPNGTGKTTLINMMAGLKNLTKEQLRAHAVCPFLWGSPAELTQSYRRWKIAATLRGFTVLILIMSKRFAGGCVVWKNTLINLSAFIHQG